MSQFILGVVLSAVIGVAGYRAGSLSRGGVVGAVVTGSLIFGLGGLLWAGLLVLFFVSSSALSHWRAGAKSTAAEKFAKGGRRDLAQALANGGMGALLAVGQWVWPHPLWLAAFVGAMAAVTADTWATEIGVLSRSAPRLITTGRKAAVGTSGAVSGLGTGAALMGGAVIGAGAAVLGAGGLEQWIVIGAVSGLVSALFDSVLGATVQGTYRCAVCGETTERTVHHGESTQLVRGWRWLDNDGVNFVASAVGAGLGVVVMGMVGS